MSLEYVSRVKIRNERKVYHLNYFTYVIIILYESFVPTFLLKTAVTEQI